MNTGKIISDLRDQKGWSQSELATQSGISRVMIGKYERGEAIPSIEVAKKIADSLDVSLDYLVGEGVNAKFDKKTSTAGLSTKVQRPSPRVKIIL